MTQWLLAWMDWIVDSMVTAVVGSMVDFNDAFAVRSLVDAVKIS